MIPERLKDEGGWDKITWNYIKGLSEAIESVPKNYICNCDEGGDNRFHVERVFAYELYYRWKKILYPDEGTPQSILLNAELTKHYYSIGDYNFPDLILHGGYNIHDKQFIIGEIKSSRNAIEDSALEKDMKSLCNGLNILSYKCAVFIYLDIDGSLMITRLRDVLHKIDFNYAKKIIFVCVNKDNCEYSIL